MTIASTTPAMRTIQTIGNNVQIVFAVAFVLFQTASCVALLTFDAVVDVVRRAGIPAEAKTDALNLYQIMTPTTMAISVATTIPIIAAPPAISASLLVASFFIGITVFRSP